MRFAAFAMVSLAAVVLTAPSYARPDETPAPAKKKVRDPNETICEDQEVLGSRLAVNRVCLTRAQWAEKERDDRALVNRSQTQLCVADGGKCSRGS